MTIVLKEKKYIFILSVALGLLVSFLFMLLEPTISRAQAASQFTITQVVTAEISFSVPPSNVTMSGQLAGLTGGTSNGQTQLIVTTNSTTGYNMTIVASSSPAMQGNTGGGTIPNYTPASASIPDYAFSVGANTGEFAYTISASTTSDLAQKFLDNASVCNAGSADTSGSTSCWYNMTTVATSTINRSTATAASGATSTIFFRVQITANPSPTIPSATYVATSTLTATVNP